MLLSFVVVKLPKITEKSLKRDDVTMTDDWKRRNIKSCNKILRRIKEISEIAFSLVDKEFHDSDSHWKTLGIDLNDATRRDTTRYDATQERPYWMKFKKRVNMSVVNPICKCNSASYPLIFFSHTIQSVTPYKLRFNLIFL